MTPNRQLEPDLNRFQVLLSDDGDVTFVAPERILADRSSAAGHRRKAPAERPAEFADCPIARPQLRHRIPTGIFRSPTHGTAVRHPACDGSAGPDSEEALTAEEGLAREPQSQVKRESCRARLPVGY